MPTALPLRSSTVIRAGLHLEGLGAEQTPRKPILGGLRLFLVRSRRLTLIIITQIPPLTIAQAGQIKIVEICAVGWRGIQILKTAHIRLAAAIHQTRASTALEERRCVERTGVGMCAW